MTDSPPARQDQLVQVTRPWTWVALAALGLLLLAAGGWVAFGKVTETVEAKGVLMREGGVRPLKANCSGVLTKFHVVSGERGSRGKPLATVKVDGEGEPEVTCPDEEILVLKRVAREGEAVKKGDVLLWYELPNKPMLVRVYAPIASGYRVASGRTPPMRVEVVPSNAKQSEAGYLVGEVLSASKYPVNEDELKDRLQDPALARHLLADGPCLQILVKLHPDLDSNARSGVKWSSPAGKNIPLYSGIPCQARIVVREAAPISLVFPGLSSQPTESE